MGEVVVGAAFGIFGRFTVRHGRDSVVMLGFLASMLAFFLIFLILPKEAPLGETQPWHTAFIGEEKLAIQLLNLSTFQIFKHSKIQSFNRSTIHLFNRLTIQLFNYSSIQPFNYSIQLFNHSTVQLFNNSTVYPFKRLTVHLFNCSTIQPFHHSTN